MGLLDGLKRAGHYIDDQAGRVKVKIGHYLDDNVCHTPRTTDDKTKAAMDSNLSYCTARKFQAAGDIMKKLGDTLRKSETGKLWENFDRKEAERDRQDAAATKTLRGGEQIMMDHIELRTFRVDPADPKLDAKLQRLIKKIAPDKTKQ